MNFLSDTRWFPAVLDGDPHDYRFRCLPPGAFLAIGVALAFQAMNEAARAARAPVGREDRTRDEEPLDIVQVASEGSFPASDPPCWTLGREGQD